MHSKTSNQSRRQVQRRFPPGSWVVSGNGSLAFVIAWVPTRPEFRRDGTQTRAQGWEAMLLANSRIFNMDWERMGKNWTLEEWEQS